MKNITNTWQLLIALRNLNPAVQFDTDEDITYISINCPPEGLILPEPFYYNKNGITNEHRTKNGAYISLPVW
jgi:hypothetical protein